MSRGKMPLNAEHLAALREVTASFEDRDTRRKRIMESVDDQLRASEIATEERIVKAIAHARTVPKLPQIRIQEAARATAWDKWRFWVEKTDALKIAYQGEDLNPIRVLKEWTKEELAKKTDMRGHPLSDIFVDSSPEVDQKLLAAADSGATWEPPLALLQNLNPRVFTILGAGFSRKDDPRSDSDVADVIGYYEHGRTDEGDWQVGSNQLRWAVAPKAPIGPDRVEVLDAILRWVKKHPTAP